MLWACKEEVNLIANKIIFIWWAKLIVDTQRISLHFLVLRLSNGIFFLLCFIFYYLFIFVCFKPKIWFTVDDKKCSICALKKSLISFIFVPGGFVGHFVTGAAGGIITVLAGTTVWRNKMDYFFHLHRFHRLLESHGTRVNAGFSTKSPRHLHWQIAVWFVLCC